MATPPAVLHKLNQQAPQVATTPRKTNPTHKIPTLSSNNTRLNRNPMLLHPQAKALMALRIKATYSHHIRALRPNPSRVATTRHSNPEQQIITSSNKIVVLQALMGNHRPGMEVREQNIIISSRSPGMGQIHTVANMEGTMQAPERTLTEVEGMERWDRTGRGDLEARLLEGLQELLSAVSLDLARLGVLSGALLSRIC